MRPTSRLRLALLAAGGLATLAACGGGSTAASGSASTTPASPPPTSASVAPSTTRAAAAYADVPTYHQDAQRSGLSADTPAVGTLALAWGHDLDAPVYAQPIVVGGLVLVATENDSVYAFDATTGTQRWRRHLATPQQSSSLPCGDIDPTAGITGTPAYDPATGTVFLVADELGPHHYLYGLDPATGATRSRVDADVPGSDPRVEQQRGALAITGGQVYAPYGALAGDCGDYHGEVVTASTSTGKIVATLALPTKRGGGIWAPSGPTVSKAGAVYVTSANSAAQPGDAYEQSNGTLRLSAQLRVTDSFAASDWQTKDREDLGQGSTGPTLLDDGLVVTAGKDLPNYVLDAGHLGGIGGQLATSAVCAAYGGTAHSGSTVFVPCTGGLTAVTASRTGLTTLWKASSAITGAPVLGGGDVFALAPADGVLHAVSAATGKEVGSVTLPTQTTRFATPALWGTYAFVGTDKGIVAVSGA